MYRVVDRPVTVNYSTTPNRPITGFVVHDSESLGPLTVAQSLGSWHWLIDRDGTTYCDVSEQNVAWHVRACDRWRPAWMVAAPKQQFSDANYATIGVELVSHATYRQAGIPFTDDQYAALKDLWHNLTSRYGPLPTVGHGQLQLDRSDPVEFDWARAGFSAFRDGWGYPWQEVTQTEPAPVPGVPSYDDLVQALRLANDIKFEFEKYIRDPAHRQSVDEAAAQEGNQPADLMIRWGNDHALAGDEAPY